MNITLLIQVSCVISFSAIIFYMWLCIINRLDALGVLLCEQKTEKKETEPETSAGIKSSSALPIKKDRCAPAEAGDFDLLDKIAGTKFYKKELGNK